MDAKNLMKDAQNLTDFQFEQKLNSLVRENYRYKNLSSDNRKIILELFKKYKSNLRKGIGITYDQRTREGYKLNQDKLKLGLTDGDIKDIKEILALFKK